ncbi:MAG: SseB family protein [Lachnospiraceae bacterium]|nr:SseB family protein [Lachnospiraceae bacterium]
MAGETSFLLKKFEKADALYALFSQSTKLPFVEMDEETYEDCAYLFTDKDQIQDFIKPYAEKKIMLAAGQVKGAAIRPFLSSLYCYGMNAIRYVDGGTVMKEELSKVIESPDLDAMKNSKIPRANPEMQLTAMYFVQELKRPVKRELPEQKHLKELEEEMAVNMMRSQWIVCADISDVTEEMTKEEAAKKMKLPYVKTKNGDIYQPIFSDFTECQKFNQDNKGAKLRLMAVSYDDIPKYSIREAKGICFNPKGVNLFLTKEMLEKMKAEYGE